MAKGSYVVFVEPQDYRALKSPRVVGPATAENRFTLLNVCPLGGI